MKPLTTGLVALGIFLTIFGLFFIQPSHIGYAVVPKNPSFGKTLVGSGLSIVMIVSATEVEGIKKYMEKRHHRKFPEFDMTYSDETYLSFLAIPGMSTGELKYELKRVALAPVDELAEKIDRSRFTIIHPTKNAVRKMISNVYRYVNGLYKNQKMTPEEREKEVNRALKYAERYADTCKYWEESVYERTWHEMGHILTRAYGFDDLPSPVCEGVAVAYGFKGLLLGTKKGRFSVERTLEQIKSRIQEYKSFTKGKESLELVLGDFEQTVERFDPSAGDLGGLIAELDKRIDYALRPQK